MSRWFTPASSASEKPAAASSGVQVAKAAPPRTATVLSCPVRPSLRRSMPSTVDPRDGLLLDDHGRYCHLPTATTERVHAAKLVHRPRRGRDGAPGRRR